MFEEVQISPPEEGKVPKKGRELPQKQTWGFAEKRGGGAAAQAQNNSSS